MSNAGGVSAMLSRGFLRKPVDDTIDWMTYPPALRQAAAAGVQVLEKLAAVSLPLNSDEAETEAQLNEFGVAAPVADSIITALITDNVVDDDIISKKALDIDFLREELRELFTSSKPKEV
jgi:hypothetical protein